MIWSASGELFELKAELNSEKRDLKKDAIKKVIASMTVGKDVRCVNNPLAPVLAIGAEFQLFIWQYHTTKNR